MNKNYQVSSPNGPVWGWTETQPKAEQLAPFFTSDPDKYPTVEVIQTKTQKVVASYDAVNKCWKELES